MKLQTTPEMLNTMAISASVCVITSSNALVDAKELSALIADAREAHRLHAELQVSAAENLSKEEATRGTSPATPPPDVCPEGAEEMAKRLEKRDREIELIIDVAHRHGWNGTENSKILWVFLDDALANANIAEHTRDAAQAEANRLLEENRKLRKDIDEYHTFVEAIRRINIQMLLADQRRWSAATFGQGNRTAGILAHIRKELTEIEANPEDLEEWIDVILLAIDGFWRHGGWDLSAALWAKRDKNRARKWPPPGPEDQPTEHIKE